jgi:hypothetical protein
MVMGQIEPKVRAEGVQQDGILPPWWAPETSEDAVAGSQWWADPECPQAILVVA